MELKEAMLNAARKHAEAEVELHKTNIEVYLQKVVGIGEHSDIIETIQKELDAMAAADDRLEMLNKYFTDTAEVNYQV
jgi:transposase